MLSIGRFNQTFSSDFFFFFFLREVVFQGKWFRENGDNLLPVSIPRGFAAKWTKRIKP